MGMLKMMCYGKYVNADAVENVIRYVTRSRRGETRQAELLGYGGAGIGFYLMPEQIIGQFLYVQDVHRIDARKGRRVYHETFGNLNSEFELMGRDLNLLHQFATECCRIYYQKGHQVLYAIHWDEKGGKGLHIHFIVNTINFQNGKKWHTSKAELLERQELFNGILNSFLKNIFAQLF